jgi:hypothetical protein
MWSGRATTWERDPRRYARVLAADIKKTYPQLGEAGADYVWSGTLGNSIHRMPQIGELGPGVWLASGFGGHGLNTTAMAGNLIARAIVDGDQTWRQFTPFELVWAGGIVGRAVAQTYYWTKRLRAAVAERRARAAELAHRTRAADFAKDLANSEQARSSASVQDEARTESEAESLVPPAAESEILPAAAQRRKRRWRREGAKA